MASTPHTAGDPGKNSSKIKFNPLDPELKLPVLAGLCFCVSGRWVSRTIILARLIPVFCDLF